MKKENKIRLTSLALAGIMSISGGFKLDKKNSKINLELSPIEVLANDDISVAVNLDELEFDVNPTLKNNRTFVPMRKIFEALNATVSYDDETKTIRVNTVENDELVHKIGTNKILKNGSEELKFDVNSYVEDGRTLVPVRFVAESLGADVLYTDDWRGKNVQVKKVIKESNGNTTTTNRIIKAINNNKNIGSEEKKYIIESLTPLFNDMSKYIKPGQDKIVENIKIMYGDDFIHNMDGVAGYAEYGEVMILHIKDNSFAEMRAKDTLLHEFLHTFISTSTPGINEGLIETLLKEYFPNYSISYLAQITLTKIYLETFGKDNTLYAGFNDNSLYKNDETCENFKINEMSNDTFINLIEKNEKALADIVLDTNNTQSINQDQYELKNLTSGFINDIINIYEEKTGLNANDNKLLMAYFDCLDYKNRIGVETYMPALVINNINYNYFNNPTLDNNNIMIEYIQSSNSNFDYYDYNIGPKYINQNNKQLKLTK